MTEMYQLHTPRRLYGANVRETRWTGDCVESQAQDSSANKGAKPVGRRRVDDRIRHRALSGTAAAFVASVSAFGLIHLGIRVANAIPLGHRILHAIGLDQQSHSIRLDGVKASVVKTTDGDVLMVEGSLLNERTKPTEAPNLRFAVRGEDRREMYVWLGHPPKAILNAGESVTFRTRLETPPVDGETVWVRAARSGETTVPIEDGL